MTGAEEAILRIAALITALSVITGVLIVTARRGWHVVRRIVETHEMLGTVDGRLQGLAVDVLAIGERLDSHLDGHP
ncbi:MULTISPECIES: hypothetical protein [Protofrankia]|uniref:Uncharacterized protein n=1 Tax=Protofrankia coriariae TaxID=1562887 RepID=A0ABR5F4F3_9ACTN|nr:MULTISPECIES: hypothetical protein [Protofrankia]KLL11588.1 hypothetical protein FrCorBMG51_11180 [Protofrankia coriariae]ONH35725.1 hypothetical protein BL254_10575 [Protofrankia sp. BMG5.30]